MDWFLYYRDLRQERVEQRKRINNIKKRSMRNGYCKVKTISLKNLSSDFFFITEKPAFRDWLS